MGKGKSLQPIILGEHFIPVTLYKEWRRSIRFSITKKGLVIRCPIVTPIKELVDHSNSWCQNLLVKNPGALVEFKYVDYTHSPTIELYGDTYDIEFNYQDISKDQIKWDKNKINIILSEGYNAFQASTSIRDLLTKFAVRRYTTTITERVHQLNEAHFNVEINHVRLKNNRTNWGSCSSKGNINLSIRLLKAPHEVLDYVIIHELAHRIEMNHSKKFWKLVEDVCPNHKTYEKWLKENSHLCHI